MAVIGLGYVGLPIALEFARKIKVVGFDINQARVDLMKKNIDPSNELEASAFDGCDIEFTANIEDLRDVQFYIVAVPTPIDDQNLPDLKPLLGASKTVGQVLKAGDYVVHIDHGIGKYAGLEKIDVNGKTQEAIRLIYADGDLLYVNINSLNRISKYSGKDGTIPKTHKLGSEAWEKLKKSTKKK